MIGGASLPELIVSALIVFGGAFALIGSWGLARLPSLMVVSPVAGGVERARALAKRLHNAPLAIVDSLGRVLPWEVLDTYVSAPASADGLDPDTVADLEPRLRNLECDKPHKLGGQIDTVYGDPLKKGHIHCSSSPQTQRLGGPVATLG